MKKNENKNKDSNKTGNNNYDRNGQLIKLIR